MGVPKFFCYVSERYPCLSELVREFMIPEFDNLYLDMNGIIHNCSHPCDEDPNFVITEEAIFASIFHYIEVLFNMIKPRKLFFLAVDGVAPRAKMNQQRGRRFRTAKDAEMLNKKYIQEKNQPPKIPRFDSNCITPGTVFMDRLHSQLKYFITSKISTYPSWRDCKIILSGHQTPGEGEHKIMDYIRYLKTLPDYDPNTKHCFYGLDADLIMLGLCTHEPHFCLLREKVQFGKKRKVLSPDETEFYLLHLSIMREYIGLEFQELKENLPFEYNLEKIIDDWVLMGFLVGNDFIPHLPGLHINKGALPILYETYKEVLPTLDGYLNENGYLNLPRFQAYMKKLGEYDIKVFKKNHSAFASLDDRAGQSIADEMREEDVFKNSELEELVKATNELFLNLDEGDEDMPLEDDTETFILEFYQHKKNYYVSKLNYAKVTEEVLQSQAEGYIRAIQWNLHYYYQGCQSWSWYYPHHYSPYISDIKNFEHLKLDFNLGKPFLPFEQLLAVLPAASNNLMPEVYRKLMTSPNSPIKDYYPDEFETDLNGKSQEWEAVVLIPFIDEERLLAAMEPCKKGLTSDEKRRNSHGPMHVFTYTERDLGIYKSIEYFPSIPSNHALRVDVDLKCIAVNVSNLKFGLRPGVLLDVYYPGFPTLKHIPYTAFLKECSLKIFDWISRGKNMILRISEREFLPLKELAKDFLGQLVYVNWPHLIEAKVVAISDENFKYTLSGNQEMEEKELEKHEKTIFGDTCNSLKEFYFSRRGIEIGVTNVVVYVTSLEGRKYTFGPLGNATLDRVWSTVVTPHPLQTVLKDIEVYEEKSLGDECSSFQDFFPIGSKVFMLGQPHLGAMGTVMDSSECLKNERLKIAFDIVTNPIVDDTILESKSAVYMPCRVAAIKVGVSPKVLAQITGCIFVLTSDGVKFSKSNIGLNLKHSQRNEELPGYTKKENDIWMYSMKTVDLVSSYAQAFPQVVQSLSDNSNQNKNNFTVHELFPGAEDDTELLNLTSWIKAQEFNTVEPIKVGSQVLESETISKLVELVDNFTPETVTKVLQVKPRLLYKADLVFGNSPPFKCDKNELFDRVVSVKTSYTVPVGLRGFIIGKHVAPTEAECLYDILFDEPFVGGMTINSPPQRAFKMLRNSFLNLTAANRGDQGRTIVNSNTLSVNLEPQVKLMPPNSRPEDAMNKQSAFAPWNQQAPGKPAAVSTNDDHFRELWQNLQSSKPDEGTDVLKKLLKIEDKKKPVIEEPVMSFIQKVSTSSKSKPPSQKSKKDVQNGGPIVSVVKTDSQPPNRYCVQLFSYYQRKSLGQPRYNYVYVGDKIIAEIQMRDGKVYSGLPCDEKVSASESAALQALGALGQIPLNNETTSGRENKKRAKRSERGPVKTPASNHRGADQAEREGGNASREESKERSQPYHGGKNKLPFSIPPPPSQWVGLSRDCKKKHNQPRNGEGGGGSQDISRPVTGSKVSAAALEFVPLQAITGIRNVGVIPNPRNSKRTTKSSKTVANNKPEVVAATNPPVPPSNSTKPRRRPKIAANLALDQNLY